MDPFSVTVVVPTLATAPCLLDCLEALERQSLRSFQTVVVDNSGRGAIHRLGAARFRFRLIENSSNVGFGEAVNQGFRLCPAPHLAVLNDDAVPREDWLERMVAALEEHPEAGMAASRIVLAGTGRLDSAGLAIARDASSKQVGHGEPPCSREQPGEALIPSGCAALYRKAMLDETGLFEAGFFLYCEDTDLALRGHWAGWRCLYVAGAVVEHRYSASAGRASALKAYLVERNRLRVAVRCFPASWLALAPLYSLARYAWHFAYLAAGRGKTADFARDAPALLLPWLVFKAHMALFRDLPRLLRERAAVRRRVDAREFKRRLRAHLLPLREVAAQ